MPDLSDEIQYILDESRKNREKEASSQENGFSSDEEPSKIDTEIGKSLKMAAEVIRKNEAGIDTQSVVNFIRDLQ